MRPKRNSVLLIGGRLLGFVGVAVVGYQIVVGGATSTLSSFTSTGWILVFALSLTYGLANLLLAIAWRYVLTDLDIRTSPSWAVNVYAITQLAKYLPGNVFHFAGRQAVGMGHGIPARKLLKSTVRELVLLTAAGLIFTPLVLKAFFPESSILVLCFSLLFLLATGVSIVLATWGTSTARAFILYVAFLGISAALFVAIIRTLSGGEEEGIAVAILVGGSYVAAWLVGLLTPGAPAGIGVRELVLLFLLSSLFAEPIVSLSIATSRFVTITGDVLFYVGGLLINLGQSKPSDSSRTGQ